MKLQNVALKRNIFFCNNFVPGASDGQRSHWKIVMMLYGDCLMTKFNTVSAIATLSLVMGAAGAAPAAASMTAQQAQQPPAQGQQQIEPVSDAEIRNYVRSVDAVGEIIEEMRPQLQEAQTEEQASQIQLAAQEEMIEAVAENGLTPQRYNEINAAAQSDPELGQRIAEVAEQHRAQSGQ